MPRQPDPIGTFSAQIKALQDRVARLERSSPFSRSGIGITGADSFTLPDGWVVNDWLANLIGWSVITPPAAAVDYFSGTYASTVSLTNTVPAGFTNCLVAGWGTVNAGNAGVIGTDYTQYYARVTIEGNHGPEETAMTTVIDAVTVMHAVAISVPSDRIINLSLDAYATWSGGSTPSYRATFGGLVLYQR